MRGSAGIGRRARLRTACLKGVGVRVPPSPPPEKGQPLRHPGKLAQGLALAACDWYNRALRVPCNSGETKASCSYTG